MTAATYIQLSIVLLDGRGTTWKERHGKNGVERTEATDSIEEWHGGTEWYETNCSKGQRRGTEWHEENRREGEHGGMAWRDGDEKR